MKRAKQFICLLMAALLLCDTGCAQGAADTTPESAAPTAKVSSSAGTTGNFAEYEVPERFCGSWSGLEESLFVNADAEIILPDADRLFTAKVERRAFTQAEADRMIAVFTQGSSLCEFPTTTKQEYAERIARCEAMLNGEIPYEGDGTIERLPEVIEAARRYKEAAPNEGERFPAETRFHPESLPDGAVGGESGAQIIEGYAEVGGREIYCAIRNSGGTSDDYARFWDGSYGDINGLDTVSVAQLGKDITPAMSEAQAIETGDALMANLGLGNFVCDGAEPVIYLSGAAMACESEAEHDSAIADCETGYRLEYVRQVSGVPLGQTGLSGNSIEDGLAYLGTWAYERVQVYVTGDKIAWFSWTNPYTEPEIIDDNAALLPFSDIQDIFAKMVFVKNHYLLEANRVNGFVTVRNMDIDKLKLTLMRVRSKDSLSDGTIIPVWDFYGTVSARAADMQHSALVSDELHYGVVLSINAIDGTVVDRALGY
ncbi:MAG: hypothetical protein J6J62_03830 [Oscillospiraceae bacterium]|nr:hypothetical protein [Oscillospiraceae bacterium]